MRFWEEKKAMFLFLKEQSRTDLKAPGNILCMGAGPYKEIYGKAAKNASVIVAIGQCATNGGVNAAKSDIKELLDPRGIAFTMEDSSKGIVDLLGINTPVINIGGCPTHPDWVFLDHRRSCSGKDKGT